ncbi:hypothetical protein [Aquibaculum sediminis]|uniref:hypothetical protein n=1 Tax=Aquibaculum sediminis TaxID=3231907 RepID=UPI003453F0AC
MIKICLLSGCCAMLLWSANAAAQSNNPSSDWNGSYQFRSPQQIQVRLLEAEMIERKSNDYYSEFGRSNTTVYQNTNVEGDVNNDNSREFTNNFPEGYDQPLDQGDTTTTAVGAINNTAVDISNGSNINIDSLADSAGCQDGGIRVSSNPGQSGGFAGC